MARRGHVSRRGMDGRRARAHASRSTTATPSPGAVDAKLALVGQGRTRAPTGRAKATGAAKYAYDVQPPAAWRSRARCSRPHAHARRDLGGRRRRRSASPGVLARAGLRGRATRHATRARPWPPSAPRRETRARRRARARSASTTRCCPHVVDGRGGDDATARRRSTPAQPNARPERSAEPARTPQAEARVAARRGRRSRPSSARQSRRTRPSSPTAPSRELDPGRRTARCGPARRRRAASRRTSREALGVPAGTRPRRHRAHGRRLRREVRRRSPATASAARWRRRPGRPVRCMQTRREEHLIGGNRPDSDPAPDARRHEGRRRSRRSSARRYGTRGQRRRRRGRGEHRSSTRPGAADVRRPRSRTFTRARRAPSARRATRRASFALEGDGRRFAARDRDGPARGAPARTTSTRPRAPVADRRRADRLGEEPPQDAGLRPGPREARPRLRGRRVARNAGGGGWTVDLVVGARRHASTVRERARRTSARARRRVLAIVVAEELGSRRATSSRSRIGDTTLPRRARAAAAARRRRPSGPRRARRRCARARQLEALLARRVGRRRRRRRLRGRPLHGPGRQGGHVRARPARLHRRRRACASQGERRANYDGVRRARRAGCQFAQVAVDVETGVVRVEQVVAVHDAGRIVNPLTARSQVNGGVIQGISYALFEERRLDRAQGDMVNPTFDTYRIARHGRTAPRSTSSSRPS